jgi:hypothetical protein
VVESDLGHPDLLSGTLTIESLPGQTDTAVIRIPENSGTLDITVPLSIPGIGSGQARVQIS